jgi:hypothetical protein
MVVTPPRIDLFELCVRVKRSGKLLLLRCYWRWKVLRVCAISQGNPGIFKPHLNFHSYPQFPHVEHVEGVPWRGYGNAEAYVEWNGMDMDPHYGSICGFRGMDLNPVGLSLKAKSFSSNGLWTSSERSPTGIISRPTTAGRTTISQSSGSRRSICLKRNQQMSLTVLLII